MDEITDWVTPVYAGLLGPLLIVLAFTSSPYRVRPMTRLAYRRPSGAGRFANMARDGAAHVARLALAGLHAFP